MSLSRLEAQKEQEESQRTEKYLERVQKPKDLKAYRKKLVEEEQEKNIYAFQMLEDNIWYYRDRAGVPRGPCTTGTLRTCWVNGIIDQYTLVWGMGLGEWLPVRNVTSLEAIIRNAETIVLTYAKRKLILEPALRRKAQERKRRSQELQQQQSKQGSSTAAAVAVYEDSQQQSAVARGAGESGLTQEGEQSQTPQQPRQSRRSRSAAACLSLAIPLEHALATDAGDVCTSNSE